MSLEQTAGEDLKAFERRLTEVIQCIQPPTTRWRILLVVISVCTAVGAWQWLVDPETMQVSFFHSLYNHLFFTISSLCLVFLFLMGIHKRVVAPSIIASRARQALVMILVIFSSVTSMVVQYSGTARKKINFQRTINVLFGSYKCNTVLGTRHISTEERAAMQSVEVPVEQQYSTNAHIEAKVVPHALLDVPNLGAKKDTCIWL